MSRTDAIRAFVDAAGWGAARAEPLAGDASTRRYIRYRRADDATVMLMDADPALGTPTRPFADIARHLARIGLPAPEILAWDEALGLMLLEDFGDDLLARVALRDPEMETQLYEVAVDVLVALHRHPAPTAFPIYDHAEMARLATLASQWYRAGAEGPASVEETSALADTVRDLLDRLAPGAPVLALRDYHAENLVWQPEKQGIARMGLLDFQDAGACHPAYDLVSLLEDARRDVSRDLRAAMTARYLTAMGTDADAFAAASAICASQRNLRILGIFARLSMHFDKPHYVDLIPRVWGLLMQDLVHPDLLPLRRLVTDLLPTPTPDRLNRIKSQAGQWPMR